MEIIDNLYNARTFLQFGGNKKTGGSLMPIFKFLTQPVQ